MNLVKPKEYKTEEVIDEVKYYLDPLITFFSVISPEQRKELRSYFGGGADTLFWKTFQKAISDTRNDFNPEGLKKYWEDEAKTYNDESSSYLRDTENKLKEIINIRLSNTHGDNWLILGLPKSVYIRAKKEADDQNYDSVSKGTGENVGIWDCVSLSECKDIATYGRNWSDIFESILIRPDDIKLSGGKEKKTEWIEILGSYKNKLLKPSYSISKNDYEYIKKLYLWLIDIQ